jgi:hypothetical protein
MPSPKSCIHYMYLRIYLELSRDKIYRYKHFLHQMHKIHPKQKKQHEMQRAWRHSNRSIPCVLLSYYHLLSVYFPLNTLPYQTDNSPKQLHLCWVKS